MVVFLFESDAFGSQYLANLKRKCNFQNLFDTSCTAGKLSKWQFPMQPMTKRSSKYRQFSFSGALQWRHNERDGVTNHRCLDCLLNRLFKCRSKKTSTFRVTGFCEWNPPVTGGFPSQRASRDAENVSIWWRHHARRFLQHLCAVTEIRVGQGHVDIHRGGAPRRLEWYRTAMIMSSRESRSQIWVHLSE